MRGFIRSLAHLAVVPLIASTAIPLFAGGTAIAAASPGAVYVLTNDAKANAVEAFARATDGSLQLQGTFATGGLGSGAGLGSQGALALAPDHTLLFAVNAGSNTISAFDVEPDGLSLVATAASGGIKPISLTLSGDLLYVLNAGGLANITGFRVGQNGALARIGGSSRPLSGPGPNPAQVAFSTDGELLMVTEKSTGLIDTYTVGGDGRPSQPHIQPSAGIEPFGFEFDPAGHAIVSEAFNGGPGRSAVSSYSVMGANLQVISPSVRDTQTAACWISITPDGGFAFTTNTGSGTVSSYSIHGDGSIGLQAPTAGNIGAHAAPIDLDLAAGGSFLYVLDSGFGTISRFQVGPNGGLSGMRMFGSLPASSSGLVAF